MMFKITISYSITKNRGGNWIMLCFALQYLIEFYVLQ
jgi:hypothetical protein